MNAEERTRTAITITRHIVKRALESPFTMTEMTMFEVNPEHMQDKVYDILEYLEKTKLEKTPFAPGIKKIEEDLAPPICVCGREMYEAVEGDADSASIFICRACHKIRTEGWKWG